MGEKYCLRNTRRVSIDINSSIMNALFHNDKNNEIDVQRRNANVTKTDQHDRDIYRLFRNTS